ncbi:orotidine 5'-phosphate decarboxylase [bacterium]|nr:orotidine 5'-phosphate decarboxylase [bacterium]
MLDKRQRYLQIALNSDLREAESIISQIPIDKRIIIEAGTPLIKEFGREAIRMIRKWWSKRISSFVLEGEKRFAPYIVADLKCMDRGVREVRIARKAGARAATVLGTAPIETIDAFIEECENYQMDSMIDMMNVEFPLSVLRKLKKLPKVVVLHRGVDEEDFNPEKELPFYEIQRIKSNYDIMISVAGGDKFREVEEAVFNDADIVVVWRSFYKSTAQTAELARKFLKEIR